MLSSRTPIPTAPKVSWCKIDKCVQAAGLNGSWCTTHLCSYPGGCSFPSLSCIPSKKYEDYTTCTEHKCQIEHCGYAALSTNVWCANHSCLVPGCSTIRHPFSNWCEGHTCRVVRDDDAGKPCTESLDCEKHRCAILRCGSLRNGDSKYCEDHCCTKEGCLGRRNLENDFTFDQSMFCEDHECSWHSEGTKCTNSVNDCLRHGCLKCGRTSKVLHNPGCKECKGRCEVSGCPQGSFILEWCQDHYCPVCRSELRLNCYKHTMTQLIPAMNRMIIDCIESRK